MMTDDDMLLSLAIIVTAVAWYWSLYFSNSRNGSFKIPPGIVTQSLSHSVTQSLSHSVTQSLSHSVTQSLSHSVTQSLSHSVNDVLLAAAKPS
jgi:hypothetical protein